MKNAPLVLFSLLFLFSCSATDSKEPKEPDEGYVLHKGEICLCNLSTKKLSALEISNKEIIRFSLSPKHDYIAYLQSMYRDSCVEFASIGIYDIEKECTIAVLGSEKYTSFYFERWVSDSTFAYTMGVSSHPNEHNTGDWGIASYLYTIGYGSTKSEIEWGDPGSGPRPVSKNEGYMTYDGQDGIHLLDKQTQITKIIRLEGEDIVYYKTVIWQSPAKFVFLARRRYQHQCDRERADLYCYDLYADRKQLLFRDVTNVEMID